MSVDQVLQEPPLVQLAATDKRVARTLADAERERVAAQQRIAADDAAADRRVKMQEANLRLAEQRDQVADNRAERRRARRKARRQEWSAWWGRRVDYVRNNAAAVYSGLIYGLAVSGAVYGQVDAARANGLPTPVGIVAAVAIEGTGLAMALTAQQQRLKGERALGARSLVWICTGAAVAINAIGHGAEPVKAVGLSALSALGIIVYEVRAGAKHRKALRELGMIPEPPERFGWRRWVTYPWETFAAWRLDVRDRLSDGAAALIARAEAARVERRRRADAVKAERDRQAIIAEVRDQARRAARKAAGKGEAGPALVSLLHLAHTGTPAPTLALPSPDRAKVEDLRRELAGREVELAELRQAHVGELAGLRAELVAVHAAEVERLRLVLERASSTAADSERVAADRLAATQAEVEQLRAELGRVTAAGADRERLAANRLAATQAEVEQLRAELGRVTAAGADRERLAANRLATTHAEVEQLRQAAEVERGRADRLAGELAAARAEVDQLQAASRAARPASGGLVGGGSAGSVSAPSTGSTRRDPVRPGVPGPVGLVRGAAAPAIRVEAESDPVAPLKAQVFAALDELAPGESWAPGKVAERVAGMVADCSEDTAARYYRQWRKEIADGLRPVPEGRRLRVVTDNDGDHAGSRELS